MLIALATCIIGFLVTWGLTPSVRALAIRRGIVSVPNPRSVHTKPVPYLGGLTLYVGFLAAAAFGLGVRHELIAVLAVGGGAIMLLGLIDDVRPLSASFKLAVEFLVAGGTVMAGVQIQWVTHPLGGMFVLGWWGIPLTIVWLVAVTNLLNVIDGLDGLATGITAIVGLTLFFACLQSGQAHTALLTAALAGAAIGFLPHNFNPAKIFMGDSGALFLGYAIAVISVEGPIKSAATVALFVPILALGVPIIDAAFAVWRRARSRRSLGLADRDHLHHRLLHLGYSQRQAVLLMYSASGFFGASALTLAELTTTQAALLLALVFSVVLVGLRRTGLLGGGASTAAGSGSGSSSSAGPSLGAGTSPGLNAAAGPGPDADTP